MSLSKKAERAQIATLNGCALTFHAPAILPMSVRRTDELEGLPLETPEICAAIKLESQVHSGTIKTFTPPHDGLNLLTCIHSLQFHQFSDVDRNLAPE